MNINELLSSAENLIPAWLIALLLGLAAASFLCRWYAQARYGRIREYGIRSMGVAVALLGLGILFSFIETGFPTLTGRTVVVRFLLGLLAIALVGFNWGGILVVWHRMHAKWQQ